VNESFQALAEWLNLYGYPVLFLVVFAENVGLPVPGETAVLAASLLASQPGSPLSIVWVIVLTFVAAVLGDNLGFELGRRLARPRLEQGRRFLFLTPKTLQAVEGYFEHYGTLTIFFARFVTGLRVVAAMAAGTSKMTWPRFFVANASGAAAWAVCMGLLGYFFGQSFEVLHKWLGRGALVILACVVVPVGLLYLWRHVRRLPPDTWNRLLRSQILEGALAALLVVFCVALLIILAERHQEPASEDTALQRWIAARQGTWLDIVARVGSHLGSLPVLAGLAVLLMLWLWHDGRPWRELLAILWALVASEGLGLFLLVLLRQRGLDPARALAWPFGFAGLEPLRAAAVFGMMAYVFARHSKTRGRLAVIAAVLLILLTNFSVVWSQAQVLTEVLVENAAGCLVLFIGLWWLEGYNLGPRPGPADLPDNKSEIRNPKSEIRNPTG
jgi:membrane-associated protein